MDKEFIISGHSRRGYGQGILKITKAPKGWKQIPLHGSTDFKDCLRVDYVSNESFESIEEWLRCDFLQMSYLPNSNVFGDDNPPVVVGYSQEWGAQC
jgi:hypothetical protein